MPFDHIWLPTVILLGFMTIWDWDQQNPQILMRCVGSLLAAVFILFHLAFWFPTLEPASVDTTQTNIRSLEQALELYHLNTQSYPTTEQGFEALRSLPTVEPVPDTWKGPYVRGSLPVDGWGNEIHYSSDGTAYEIWSLGEDGQPGGEGDDADIYASQL